MSNSNKRKKQCKNLSNSPRERAIKRYKPEDLTLIDCLDIVKNEYSIERAKRQSFETRAGIIITLLAAICVFMFEQISLVDALKRFGEPLTMHLAITILSAIGVYLCFGLTLYYAIKTISVKEYKNFDVSAVNESLMGKPRLEGCIEITKGYRDIITQHRKVNSDSAQTLSKSFTWMVGMIISLIIHINFN